MSARCRASDLGNLPVLWDRSIGPQINRLRVRAIRLTRRCRGAESRKQLFNSPGRRPGGHSSPCCFLTPPSSYIDSTSVNAVILSGRVLTGILLGVIVCVCVCTEERFRPMNPCCAPVLCLYRVSDPLGCSTHISIPASLTACLSPCTSLFLSPASISSFFPPPRHPSSFFFFFPFSDTGSKQVR